MAEPTHREVKINRVNPNGLTPVHVNDMLISHDGTEIYIQFSEIEPPALIDKEEIGNLSSVDAIAKVKLVMSPDFLEIIIKVLSDNYEKFKLARNTDND